MSAHAYDGGTSTINDQTFLALSLHKRFLELGRPRELRPNCDVSWYIQTDACYEPEDSGVFAGIGGVLFTPDGRPVQFFSQRLSQQMIANLNPGNRKTAIYECEFFALFCAMKIWGETVGSALVVYADNNAVRDAMISCHTNNITTKNILIATLSLESQLQLSPWYARVPTDSNLADNPSRLVVEPLLEMCTKQYKFCVEKSWGDLVACAENWGEQQATWSSRVKKSVQWSELHWQHFSSDFLHCHFTCSSPGTCAQFSQRLRDW